MDNVKDDLYYVSKIKTDLVFIIEHTKGMTKEDLEENEVLLDSIMFRIIQIAENNSKLSSGFQEQHPGVPWLAIKGMRNRIVHQYGSVDLAIVYDVVVNGIPEMYRKLESL